MKSLKKRVIVCVLLMVFLTFACSKIVLGMGAQTAETTPIATQEESADAPDGEDNGTETNTVSPSPTPTEDPSTDDAEEDLVNPPDEEGTASPGYEKGESLILPNAMEMAEALEEDGDIPIHTAQDLRDAFAALTAGDTLNLVFYNDIELGDGTQVSYNSSRGDGDANPLYITSGNITLNFKSATGEPYIIYRVDRARHLEINGSSYAPLENVTLTFAGIVLDGLARYDPMLARANTEYDSSGGGLRVNYANNFTIKGAQIRNCFGGTYLGSLSGDNGGAMRLQIIDGALVENCVFENNISAWVGGALDFLSSVDVTLKNCAFRSNRSARAAVQGSGGAIQISGGMSHGWFTIEDCQFKDNYAKGYASNNFNPSITFPNSYSTPDYGGAICVNDGYASLDIKGSVFEGNWANFGGALFFNGDAIKVTDTRFISNRAENDHAYAQNNNYAYNNAYGGAVYLYTKTGVSVDGSAQFNGNVVFDGNSAYSENGQGMAGALWISRPLTMSGEMSFLNNKAVDAQIANYGGAIYINAALTGEGKSTFEGNVASRGGAIYANVNASKPATLENAVFKNNQAVLDPLITGNLGNGAGGGAYVTTYAYFVLSNPTFTGNWAEGGGYYIDEDHVNYDAYVQLQALCADGLVSLSTPFEQELDFVYNNYDISMTAGTPAPILTVEYFRKEADGNHTLIERKQFTAGRRENPSDALTAQNINGAGEGWLNAYRPEECLDGEMETGPLPNIVGRDDLTVTVVYRNNPKWGQEMTVTFESNGGTPVTEQKVVYGNKVGKPQDPTREAHTFVGWFADEALIQPWIFADDVVEDNMVLYAKWTKDDDPAPTDTSMPTETPTPTETLSPTGGPTGTAPTITPVPPKTSIKPPKTGDGAVWTLWMILTLLATTAVTVLLYKRKRKGK